MPVDVQYGHIKRPSAEVIHQHLPRNLSPGGIIQSGRHRLIHYTNYIQTRHAPCVHRRLPADLVKVRRNANHHIADFTKLG